RDRARRRLAHALPAGQAGAYAASSPGLQRPAVRCAEPLRSRSHPAGSSEGGSPGISAGVAENPVGAARLRTANAAVAPAGLIDAAIISTLGGKPSRPA